MGKRSSNKRRRFFIDLNKITADKYDVLGPDEVKKFFPGDHTHTNEEGARSKCGFSCRRSEAVEKSSIE